jgi:hypothetical protein
MMGNMSSVVASEEVERAVAGPAWGEDAAVGLRVLGPDD